MRRAQSHGAALIVGALLLAATSSAAPQQPDACAPASASPADASLQLSLTGGQTVFHEGEIIGLTLEFTSAAAGKYLFDTRNSDRSGRLDSERFCLEPAAGRDPLDDYFRSGITGGLIGGGLGGYQALTTAPTTVHLEANEWTILAPGRYHLRLVSRRVARSAAPGEVGVGTITVPLRSNSVDLEVIAAPPAWQAAQLDAAIAALDSSADDAAMRHGARLLRFLDSEAAARELAHRYWALNDQPFGWEFMFGLIATSHRRTAIDALKTSIADPTHAVTPDLIDTLALLEIQADGRYQLPTYTEAAREAWMSARDRKLDAYRLAIARHITELSAALDAKTGTARAICLNTLLMSPGTADRARLRQMLLSSWDSIPGRTRNELIQSRWDEIGGPDLLPILRQIVNAPPNRAGGLDQPNRGSALARLYEVAPSEGRELILREILDSRGDIGIQVLTRLPDRELPEVDEPIMTRLRRGAGTEVDFQLLARYGTGKPLAELKRLYEPLRGHWACAPQTAMLRYFLRVDQPYGVAQVVDALAERQATGCYRAVLGDLKEALAIPGIERLAIAALDDSAAEVTRNAAEALGRYGSAAAEPALWRRLEKFHEAWKDRTDELRVEPGAGSSRAADSMVEYALMNALSRGEAWVCDPGKLERLKALVSPLRQTELTGPIAQWQRGDFGLSMSWFGEGRFFFNVAGYSGDSVEQLTRKVKQFPAGTRVALSLSSEVADRHQSDIDAVQQAARSAGVVLEVKRVPVR